MTSSLFSIITALLLTGATVISVCATGSSSIVNAVTVDYFPCSDPAALDASLSTILHQQPGRSQTECVSACYRHSSCTSVAHVQNDDVTSTCFLLGGISRTPAVFTQPAKCTMLILNPCPAGIAVSRGQCQCPKGLTGQFCEIQNPAECLNTWKKAYSSDGTGDLNAVVNSNRITAGGYLKAGLQDSDGSLLVLNGKIFFSDVGSNFASQNMVFKYNTNGDALSGKTLVDLDSAVRNGQVIVTYNAVHVNRSQSGAANLMHLSRYHYEISRRPGTYNFQSNSYWLTQKHSTDGKATTHRFKIADNIFRDASPLTNRAGELHLDSCWRAATGSSHNNNNNNNNSNNNTGQLISAILNGHAARVIVDDVALTLDQVSVAGDVVVFGALQYLDPVGSGAYTRDSMVVHVVATSQRQVFTCKTLPQDGTPFYNTTSAGTVTWFVDTRQQSRVYSVTSQGEVLLGQESELYAAAAKGATVHVGIVFSEPNHYLLMPVSILKLTSDDHVVAQVEGLSRLPIMEGRVTPWLDCGLRALLVTSQGTVRLYEYRHREPGTHTNLTALTIHWFVDSYADN